MLTTQAKARSDADEFIEASRIFLKDDFLPKLIHCLERMRYEDIWWRPNEQSNSCGNLVLHLCGNMRQWILNSMGEGNYVRDRDSEFSFRGPISRQVLIENISTTVNEVDKVLEKLPSKRLAERFSLQTYSASGLQAIYHVTEHFSYHLGQILYIYKMRTGKDPGFYRDLASK